MPQRVGFGKLAVLVVLNVLVSRVDEVLVTPVGTRTTGTPEAGMLVVVPEPEGCVVDVRVAESVLVETELVVENVGDGVVVIPRAEESVLLETELIVEDAEGRVAVVLRTAEGTVVETELILEDVEEEAAWHGSACKRSGFK